MNRASDKKTERPAQARMRLKTFTVPVARKTKIAAPAGLLAEMEHQRDLLQVRNEELSKVHADLEISHQRFQDLHEQAPVGYLTFDARGCIRTLNTEAARLLGIGRSSVIGKRFIVFVEKSARKKFRDHLLKIRRTPTRVATDLGLVRKDGTVRQVRMTTNRHHDAEGLSTLFLSAIEDVTELRAASASTAYLASIVEASQDAIVSFSPDGIFQSWNVGAERIFGYSAAEIIGRHKSILVPKGRRDEIGRTLKVAARGDRVPPFDTVRQRKDGTLVDVELSLSPIVESGRVVAITAIERDISERKRTEHALRESEQRFRALVMASSDALYLMSPDWSEMRHLHSQDFIANTDSPNRNWLREYIHPEDQSHVLAVIGEAIRTRSVFELEHRVLRADGTSGWTFSRAIPVKNTKGEIVEWFGAASDVTLRKRAEQKIKEGEDRFRGVLESAPDAMVIVDRKGKIELVNKQTEKLFGYTRRELIGKKVEMLMPSALRHGHLTHREEYAATPTNRPMGAGLPLFARRKDDSEFPVEISLSPLQMESGLLVCSVIRDITERKKAEEAIRTLNAKLEERVVARTVDLTNSNLALREEMDARRRLEQEVIEISETERERIGQDLHDDLGQQLAGLWYFSAALEKNLRTLESSEADNAGRIARQLDKALALTRSLAHGLQPVMPEPGGLMVALQSLAERSSELFKIKCRLSCRHPVKIHDPAVATHLYRIAQEAVTNAARHAQARHISILLSSSSRELILSVTDDGKGMPEAPGKHEGMGIRTMKYRATALGGSLIFRNKPRKGTRVVCAIPLPEKKPT